MTLADYVRDLGGQEKAARSLGVPVLTIGRWLRRENQPSRMAWLSLNAAGIDAIGEWRGAVAAGDGVGGTESE